MAFKIKRSPTLHAHLSFLCCMTNTATHNKQENLQGFAFALLAVILWSGNFIAARGLHSSISPIALSFFRWLLATFVLFPMAYKKVKAEFHLLRQSLLFLSLTAITGVTIFNTLLYVAGHYTTATNMALIGTTAAPVFVFLISGLFLKQHLSVYQIIGILLCITGILVLLSGGSLQKLKNLQFTIGDFWVLGAALAFALYTLLVRRKPAELSAIAFLFAVFFLGTLFLIPAFLLNTTQAASIIWTLTLTSAIAYLGVFASVVAFLAWNNSINRIGPARTALFGNLIPVFSTLEAVWILHESFSALTLVSFLIIVAGIVVANLPLLKTVFAPQKKS